MGGGWKGWELGVGGLAGGLERGWVGALASGLEGGYCVGRVGSGVDCDEHTIGRGTLILPYSQARMLPGNGIVGCALNGMMNPDSDLYVYRRVGGRVGG